MAVNDSFAKATDSLPDGSDLIADGSGAGTGAVNVTEIAATGAVEIYREVDTAGDGSWAVSVQVDNISNEFGSQGNDYLASQSQSVRIRVRNASGGPIDALIAGYEVDD